MVGVKITLWTCSIVLIVLGCIVIYLIREDLRHKDIPSAVALILLDIWAFAIAIVAILCALK